MADQSSPSVRKIVGLNIVKLRTSAGLSQNELGVRLEQWLQSSWSRQAVSQAEQGNRAFGVDDLIALSVGLDASVQQLLTPPKDVESVILASGTELSALTYKEVVLGGAVEEMEEVQQTRVAVHLGELNFMAGIIAQRQKELRSRLRDGAAADPAASRSFREVEVRLDNSIDISEER